MGAVETDENGLTVNGKTLGRPIEYDAYTIERALAELALCDNRPTLATRRLAHEGIKVPVTTLIAWRDNRPDQWQAIQAREIPQIQAKVADDCERLALTLNEAEEEAVEQLRGNLDKLDPKDQAGAIRNLATAKAINIDKMQLLRNKPTAINVGLDADQLLRSLQSIDGTAEELDSGADTAQHSEMVPSR